jgi:hypothetical protein
MRGQNLKADAKDGMHGRLQCDRMQDDSEPWFDDNPCLDYGKLDIAVRMLSTTYSEHSLMQHFESEERFARMQHFESEYVLMRARRQAWEARHMTLPLNLYP